MWSIFSYPGTIECIGVFLPYQFVYGFHGRIKIHCIQFKSIQFLLHKSEKSGHESLQKDKDISIWKIETYFNKQMPGSVEFIMP